MEPQKYTNPGAPAPDAETTVRTITLRDAVEEIRKLADAYPDKVAGGSLTTMFGYPGEPRAICIMGHAYADWGIPLVDLSLWENAVGAERWLPGTGPDEGGEPVDFSTYGLRFTAAAAAFLRQCQRLQDSGIAWGTVFYTMLGRAHVVFGTDLHDEGDLYEHGEPLSWPELTPTVIHHG